MAKDKELKEAFKLAAEQGEVEKEIEQVTGRRTCTSLGRSWCKCCSSFLQSTLRCGGMWRCRTSTSSYSRDN